MIHTHTHTHTYNNIYVCVYVYTEYMFLNIININHIQKSVFIVQNKPDSLNVIS